ncbi:hypothetical protein HORIV_52190 [Vreelandella olivaria]|uniref:Uncharacterized protein n=1 Tax=Vreelandella olivaria TaxID=390919 RepID=A0ABM7GLX6_9GAMM|nr:hypothetical protein HORIV_52190 [Halomonas olivaria]
MPCADRGAETAERRSELEWALNTVRDGGHKAEGAIRAGEVDEALQAYEKSMPSTCW